MTPRDEHFYKMVLEYRELSKTATGRRKRDPLFARMHNLQVRNLEHYSYKFRSPRIAMSKDDAMQATVIGFLRAIEKWDPEKGAWITCLFLWCRREVQDAQGVEPVVYRPHNIARPYAKYRQDEAFFARQGRDATAAELGVTQKEFDRWQTHECFQRIDLDAPLPRTTEESHYGRDLPLAPSAFTLEKPMTALELLEAQETELLLRALTDDEKEILLGSDCEEKEELRARFV